MRKCTKHHEKLYYTPNNKSKIKFEINDNAESEATKAKDC